MKNIIVFTDGAFLPKSNRAGYGIHFPSKELPDMYGHFTKDPITSPRAELYAILRALTKITKNLVFDTVTVYTDSEYSIKSLTLWLNGWIQKGWKTANNKPVKNVDLIKPIANLMELHQNKIKFVHVRSHTGKTDPLSLGNARADELAGKGAKLR